MTRISHYSPIYVYHHRLQFETSICKRDSNIYLLKTHRLVKSIIIESLRWNSNWWTCKWMKIEQVEVSVERDGNFFCSDTSKYQCTQCTTLLFWNLCTNVTCLMETAAVTNRSYCTFITALKTMSFKILCFIRKHLNTKLLRLVQV